LFVCNFFEQLTPDGKQRSPPTASIAAASSGSGDAHMVSKHMNYQRVDVSEIIPLTPGTIFFQAERTDDEDSFFDLLSRFQSKRMDDQRCSLKKSDNKENTHSNNGVPIFKGFSQKLPPVKAPTLPNNGINFASDRFQFSLASKFCNLHIIEFVAFSR